MNENKEFPHELELNLKDLKKMVESPTIEMPKFKNQEEKIEWIKKNIK